VLAGSFPKSIGAVSRQTAVITRAVVHGETSQKQWQAGAKNGECGVLPVPLGPTPCYVDAGGVFPNGIYFLARQAAVITTEQTAVITIEEQNAVITMEQTAVITLVSGYSVI